MDLSSNCEKPKLDKEVFMRKPLHKVYDVITMTPNVNNFILLVNQSCLKTEQ